MATDRSTDDYKGILCATVHGLLQNPTPQNKMDMLAHDAVRIADLVTAALQDAKDADQDEGDGDSGTGDSTPGSSAPSKPAPAPTPPSIPAPPTTPTSPTSK